MPTSPTLAPSQLRRVLELAGFDDGQRFELAATRPGRHGLEATWARLTPDGLRRASSWAQQRDGRCNLYLGSNPIRDDRQRGRDQRARAVDVASMATLLLDVDPVKVKPKDVERGHLRDTPKTPVTDDDLDERGLDPAKLQAAEEIADELRAFIQAELGVLPPLISSGRGRQIWLRIDGDHERPLRKRLVRALGDRFSRWGLAVVDPPTHDPSRLMRLVGSVNLGTGERAKVLDPGDGGLAAVADVVALVERLDPPKPKKLPRARRATWSPGSARDEDERLEDALQAIPADDYETWVSVGMALAASGRPDGYALWDRWSSTGSGYEGQSATAAKWRSFSPDGGIGVGTLFKYAIDHGWVPPTPPEPVELDPEDEATIPPLEIAPPPRAITDPDAAQRLIRSVLTTPKPRGGQGRVVQDRRPTGSGKTTGAAAELVGAVADRALRFLWASPSHDHGRQEALLALARAGAAIWDEDLDGPTEERGVRQKLEAAGALILPVGEPAPNAGTPVAGKTAPFYCPGPAVDGWTSDSVEQLYAEVASRDWNPASTVCRACPRFLGDNGDPCPYWERRRLVAEADVLVVPHHSLGGDSGRGRACVVIDEDPSAALIRRVQADRRGTRAFLVLLDNAVGYVAAAAAQVREELDQVEAEISARARTLWDEPLPSVDQVLKRGKLQRRSTKASALAEQVLNQAAAAELVVSAVIDRLDDWSALGDEIEDAYAFPAPNGLDVAQLSKLEHLTKECERTLRSLARRGEKLTDTEGRRVGAPRNLFLFLRQVAKAWTAGRDAVLHTSRSDRDLAAIIPTVAPLPPCSILALDATGDPNLLELATGRAVELVEGELVAELTGIHLADVPCGRARWSKRRHRKDTAPAFNPKSGALAADVTAIIRYAQRVGADRVGLVTFKAAAEHMTRKLGEAGLEVRSLHYGGEAGSNAFEGWADLVVVAGTPYVPPAEIRLRAALQGASVDEILAEPAWEPRRLPGGGSATLLTHGSEPARKAYQALIAARLEQSLGRAARWDWTPRCGVLVLAEPWPSRHRLTHSTRRAEALDGPTLEIIDHLDGLEGAIGTALRERLEDPKGGLPRSLVTGRVRSLVFEKTKELGGTAQLAEKCRTSQRSVQRWTFGNRSPNVSDILFMLSSPKVGHSADIVQKNGLKMSHLMHSSWSRNVAPNFPNTVTTETPTTSPRNYVRGHCATSPLIYKYQGDWSRNVPPLGEEAHMIRWPSRYEHRPNLNRLCYPADASWADLVEDAIGFAGGVAQLAEAVEVNRKTVERWKARPSTNPRAKNRAALEAYCAKRLAEQRALEDPKAAPGAAPLTGSPNTGESAPVLTPLRGGTREPPRSHGTGELCARERGSVQAPPPPGQPGRRPFFCGLCDSGFGGPAAHRHPEPQGGPLRTAWIQSGLSYREWATGTSIGMSWVAEDPGRRSPEPGPEIPAEHLVPPGPGDGWRLLAQDEVLLDGDEGWTWADPECTRLGWVPVDPGEVGREPKGFGRVPIRRRVLHSVPAGTQLPAMGRTYAPAAVPASDLPSGLLPRSPAPPPRLTPAEEIARGLDELRSLASAPDPMGFIPPWLARAARRSGSSLNRFVSWLTRRAQADGTYAVDVDRALERAQDAQLDVHAPIYVRRLWGHVVQLLLRRGAKPRGQHAVKVGQRGGRGALKRAREAAGKPGQLQQAGERGRRDAVQDAGLRRLGRAAERIDQIGTEDVVQQAHRELNGVPDSRAGPGRRGRR